MFVIVFWPEGLHTGAHLSLQSFVFVSNAVVELLNSTTICMRSEGYGSCVCLSAFVCVC